MAIVLDGTTGITTPNVASTTSTLGPLTQALNLGSTGQIVFPATQNASANANTLDDYEEGTFSATFWSGGNGTGTNLGTSTNNRYTKIGRTVTIAFARENVGSGLCLSFTGFPFANTPTFGISGVSADSVVFYADSATAVNFRGSGDGQYCRGCFTYQTT